jgi:hypothetical protein
MLLLAPISRRIARRELLAQGLEPSSRLMVSASFAYPLRRRVLLDEGGRYHYGVLSLAGKPTLAMHRVIETNESVPEAVAAASAPEGRRFLVWSRFPFYVIQEGPEGTLVRIADARYSQGRRAGDWASVEVRLPPAQPSVADSVPAP